MLYIACALIKHNNNVLICQRSAKRKLPLKQEFPDGKIEYGESKATCLHREIQEELSIEIAVEQELTMIEYHYPELSLCHYPFVCKWIAGDLLVVEHKQALWVNSDELLKYNWAESDLPFLQEYVFNLSLIKNK